MLLAETSIDGAMRDAMSDGEISSFHYPQEHHAGLENDHLKFLCGSCEPVYSGDTDIGIVKVFRDRK